MVYLNSNFVCPSCREGLIFRANTFFCIKCQLEIPLLDDSIPILVQKPNVLIFDACLKISRHLTETQQTLLQLISKKVAFRDAKMIDAINKAFAVNNDLLEVFQKKLWSTLRHDDVRKMIYLAELQGVPYIFDLNYLRRDWCMLPESEEEITAINNALRQVILPHIHGDESSLILGAGTGRIAFELTSLFTEVLALDNSLITALLFNALQHRDISFYEINLNNAQSPSHVARQHVASSKTVDRSRFDRIQYIVAEAESMPFSDHCFSAIISVYFTDVIPLPKLLSEVKRVLKPGGLFVHFGPLQYHFNDQSFKLSFEEVKEFLQKEGMEILQEDKITSFHCRSSINGSQTLFTNWVLVARKREKDLSINETSVLSLAAPLELSFRGMIGLNYEELEAILHFSDGDTYRTNHEVLNILKAIDGKRTFKELLEFVQDHYEVGDGNLQLLLKNLLSGLMHKGAITIDHGKDLLNKH